VGLHLRLSKAPSLEVLARPDERIRAQLEFAAQEAERWEADIQDRGDCIRAVFTNLKREEGP
jgi:hypothetical protein